jgi:RNA polymerase sigma-70 factor (ECF subfamily)
MAPRATLTHASLRGGDPSLALVHRAQRGDAEAFSQLYEQYFPRVYSYVLRHVSQPEVAQDLTSDVFLRAMEHLDSYRFQDVPFASWLYRIAHNRVIDHYRRLPKQPPVELADQGPFATKPVTMDSSWILNRKVVHDALKVLTPEQREVIIRRLLQGQSIAETARALNRSEDSVKQLQRRGLAALERMLHSPSLSSSPTGF